MCGIFGIVSKSGLIDSQHISKALEAIEHRGPDGSGIHVANNVGLGHRRLSIIDLSVSASQPMKHHALPIWIVFNGEIYNYIELRTQLIALGHHFYTDSDTEVLLAAYVEWGERCLEQFNGMWAFALHDERSQTLFCARDRFGVKPFYYTETHDFFVFGSEIRQLLPYLASRKANPTLVNDYLVCGLTDHTQDTFFAGVKKLLPGHLLRMNTQNMQTVWKRYYVLEPNEGAAADKIEDAPRIIRTMLDDAVRLRLRSDVPVGTCLSGGLDSSSIALLASAQNAGQSNQVFRAITAISEQKSNSEEAYAAEIVALGQLHWIRVKPHYDDFKQALNAVMETQEEPYGGPSILMQYFVMQAAQEQGIKVLLDGQGGDETLLGYERYYPAWLMSRWQQSGIWGFLKAFFDAGKVNNNTPAARLAMYFLGIKFSKIRHAAYSMRYGFLNNKRLPEALVQFSQCTHDASAMQILEISTSNLPMLLRFEDKNSMRFAVETRLPFLDYRLVEYALGLSVQTKLHQGWSKWPLRMAMNDMLPQDIAWRKNKLGFNAPDVIWLEKHAPEMRKTVLNSDFIAAYVTLWKLKNCYDQLDRMMRWRLYCLAHWASFYKVDAI